MEDKEIKEISELLDGKKAIIIKDEFGIIKKNLQRFVDEGINAVGVQTDKGFIFGMSKRLTQKEILKQASEGTL